MLKTTKISEVLHHIPVINYYIRLTFMPTAPLCTFNAKFNLFGTFQKLMNSPKFPGESPGNDILFPDSPGKKITPRIGNPVHTYVVAGRKLLQTTVSTKKNLKKMKKHSFPHVMDSLS